MDSSLYSIKPLKSGHYTEWHTDITAYLRIKGLWRLVNGKQTKPTAVTRLVNGSNSDAADTADLLREIARDRSVVVVEHDMTFVRDLGVKVTVLHEGSVLAEGSLDAVSANERVIEVYLGR